MPHEDETADIQCELFEYSLPNSCKRTHMYDALSYVWGNPDEKLPIFIYKYSFDVTVNLRAALLHLRNHSIERILWVDAICIDQANQEEKEHQIQSMAKIYGQANRVVVWLGEAADDSDLALEEIRVTRDKMSTNSLDSKRIQQAVLALLQRPWFRRIWILQEIAAARHVLIMCGSKKIDGYVFCLGVDALKDLYEARPDLQGLIRSVTYLIREAIFRPGYSVGISGRSSLDICPLGELMDMYHAHEATKRHDKVYALLGMSSDDLSEADLMPNYGDPWEKLLQRLAKFLLSEKISVEAWGDEEVAAIKSKGCILGKVSSVLRDTALDGRQSVDVIFKSILGHPEYTGTQRWTLRPSAKSIRDGDLICLLQGASKPAIIRLCKDYFAIIMIAATPLENTRMEEGYIEWPNLLQSVTTFTRDFLLFWDWKKSSEKFQNPAEYDTLIRTDDSASEYFKIGREGCLDNATRTWNIALILGDLGEYKGAEERILEAIEGYKRAFGVEYPYTLKSQYGLTPLSWATGNGYDDVVHLLLANDAVDPDLKDSQYGRTPLWWAAEGGHEAVVKLLLETGNVEVDAKDSDDRTPLSRAAKGGHEAVVKLLLETGNIKVDAKDSDGRTPLSRAAQGGHEAVVKLLQSSTR